VILSDTLESAFEFGPNVLTRQDHRNAFENAKARSTVHVDSGGQKCAVQSHTSLGEFGSA